MATLFPSTITAQGPQNSNVSEPRTPIPLAAGMTLGDNKESIRVSGAVQPLVPPVVPPGPTWAGNLWYTSFYDWYYRIHVVPSVISLGNLSGDTTREILVWNAFFTNVELQSFVLDNAAGITASQPVVPPASIGPLRELTYAISVSTEGPAIINATATWTIDGVDYVVPITGQRSVLFPFRPNWADRVSEVLTWVTTVTRAWSGREQRMSIARHPRRQLSYSFQAKKEGARLLDSVLYGWMGRFYSLPIWHEESRLTAPASAAASVLLVDTSKMSIAIGSSVVLYHDEFRYEVVEVLSFGLTSINIKGVLNAAWPERTKVIPLLPAIPQMDIRTSRLLPQIATGGVSFLIDPRSPLTRIPQEAAPLQYRGEELYLEETDWGQSVDVPYVSNRRDIDSGIGPIAVSRRGSYPVIGRSFRWVCYNKQYADSLRAFFGRRKGRFSPVWMPSGTEDFILAQPVDPVSPSIVVRKSQYGPMAWPNKVRRDIIIRLNDGTVFLRRIIDVAEGADVTILTLDQGFGSVFDPSQVKRVSYLGLYRLADDSITFNWTTNYVAIVETDFTLTEQEA